MKKKKKSPRRTLSFLAILAILWGSDCSGQVCANPFTQKPGQLVYTFSDPADSAKVVNAATAQAQGHDITKATLTGTKNCPGAITLMTNADGDIYMVFPRKDEEECQ